MDICRVFKVSERWLCTGESEMFAKTDDSLIARLSAKYNVSETEQRILNIYLHLDESRQNQSVDFAVYFANQISTAETAATAENHVDPEGAATVLHPMKYRDLTRAQQEEIMKQQFDAEEKGADALLASTITSGLTQEKRA